MKKIIALVVAILMIAAMAVPAFAAEVVQGDNALKAETVLGNGTTVIYGSSQKYEVTIPETINFNNGSVDTDEESPTKGIITVDGTLTISKYSIAADKTLTVSMAPRAVGNYQEANQAEDKGWFLYEIGDEKTGANDVEYYVAVNDGQTTKTVKRGDVVASASTKTTTDDVTVTLIFTTYGTSQVASFTDNISYTVKIGK